MTAYYEETQQDNGQKPLYVLLDAFTAASGVQWPELHNGNAEKWVYPLKEISDYARDDPELRLRAIREAVKECRERDIIVANPSSIKSMALHLIAKWNGFRVNEPTESDFLAYRNKLIAMGANVLF